MKKILGLGIFLILFGIFGLSYTYTIDHRSAADLSSYCDIDFQGSVDQRGKTDDATLSIIDYRYASAQPDPAVTIVVDGTDWKLPAAIRQTPPAYDFYQPFANTAFKNTNKFFLHLPLDLLEKIVQAGEVRVRFSYDNGTVIDLPLNEADLLYWKNQL